MARTRPLANVKLGPSFRQAVDVCPSKCCLGPLKDLELDLETSDDGSLLDYLQERPCSISSSSSSSWLSVAFTNHRAMEIAGAQHESEISISDFPSGASARPKCVKATNTSTTVRSRRFDSNDGNFGSNASLPVRRCHGCCRPDLDRSEDSSDWSLKGPDMEVREMELMESRRSDHKPVLEKQEAMYSDTCMFSSSDFVVNTSAGSASPSSATGISWTLERSKKRRTFTKSRKRIFGGFWGFLRKCWRPFDRPTKQLGKNDVWWEEELADDARQKEIEDVMTSNGGPVVLKSSKLKEYEDQLKQFQIAAFEKVVNWDALFATQPLPERIVADRVSFDQFAGNSNDEADFVPNEYATKQPDKPSESRCWSPLPEDFLDTQKLTMIAESDVYAKRGSIAFPGHDISTTEYQHGACKKKIAFATDSHRWSQRFKATAIGLDIKDDGAEYYDDPPTRLQLMGVTYGCAWIRNN